RADERAPIAAYVAIMGADYRDPALCAPFGTLLQGSIEQAGKIDPTLLSGIAELAGTHGAAETATPYRLAIAGYEGGPDQSYQPRARALRLGDNARPAIDQSTFIDWIKAQPNHGGRFSLATSDAKDFAAIDVVRYQDRLLALVVEPWGYQAPAAIGESTYAGVFELLGPGRVEPRCLYKTYLRPPAHGAFDALPSFAALIALLDQVQGSPTEALDPNDRREAHLIEAEQRWSLFNMPLLGIAEVRRAGWAGWLHRRHDATLNALFSWSERDLPSKTLYRKLISLLRPAQEELSRTFAESEGLTPDEAGQAAELVLLETLDHAVGRHVGSVAIAAAAPATLLTYQQRFATAPLPGDLEAGRPIRSLHSAVLNRLPEDALADYIKYEFQTPGHAHSTGAGGETAMMAAVEVPDTVSLLLGAGADPNEANAWHKTPLMAAAQADQPETAQRLLAAGANVKAATIAWSAADDGVPMFEIHTSGRTALMYAAANATPALIALLLDRGADRQDRDSAGHRACDYLLENVALAESERTQARTLLCR
ncbi:MAG: ankyrin repeat domain-containing protein, partial [Aliidongia sp.]